MHRPYILIAAAALAILLGIGTVMGQLPFTPEGQKWAPVPSGHAIGKDDPAALDHPEMALHFPGRDCGNCHTPGRSGENYVFTLTGTAYRDKAGTIPLEGAEIIAQDAFGNVVSMTSNAAGNFFTYAPIASDPASGLPQSESNSWRYKAWVRYGDTLRRMVTIAYVGRVSAGVPRMSCNMHHSGLGTRGAFAPGAFPTLASFPQSGLSFGDHVLPILKARCKACHVPASSGSKTYYPTALNDTFDYSGGLDLSAYDKDAASAKGVPDLVNVSHPDSSMLLIKPMEGSQHAGGHFWSPGDTEYSAIRQWIAEGALDN